MCFIHLLLISQTFFNSYALQLAQVRYSDLTAGSPKESIRSERQFLIAATVGHRFLISFIHSVLDLFSLPKSLMKRWKTKEIKK
jgi:hypothetical protein